MNVQDKLSTIGQQETTDINLGEAALFCVQFNAPNVDILPYLRHIQTLVDECKAYIDQDSKDTALILESVRQVIAKRYGYGPETDDDLHPDLYNLAKIIDQRRGSALGLCLLYAHVLEHLGLSVEIVDFPARPLLRILCTPQHKILDPLQQAKVLDTSQLRALFQGNEKTSPFALNVLDKRAVLLRLQDTLKIDLLRDNAPEAAIRTLEGSMLMAPNEARLWRELGVLHSRLDHIEDSISALKHFLKMPGAKEHRYSASQMLQQLQHDKDTENP